MNFVNKDHFILVVLQAKSQTSIDVTDRDPLDRAGFRPVDRHEIVKEKSVEELNAQLVSLVGENGAEMLFLLLKTLISITAQFSPTRICFDPVLALSSALFSLQSSLSKSIDIERPIRKTSPEF